MSQAQKEGTDLVVQGHMVWGSVKPQLETIYGTRQPKINPKTGQQAVSYKFGLAVPKPSPQSTQNEIDNFNIIWSAIHTEAGKLGFTHPNNNFSFKFDDGDTKKADGTPYPEHSNGCIVIACKTNFALQLSAWENGVLKQVTEDQIKCGDYIQVALNVRGHGAPNPGLYINPSMIARFHVGDAITNAPSAISVFGAPPPPPFGAPTSPSGMVMPSISPAPVAPVAPVYAPHAAVLPAAFQGQAAAPSIPSFPGFPKQ